MESCFSRPETFLWRELEGHQRYHLVRVDNSSGLVGALRMRYTTGALRMRYATGANVDGRGLCVPLSSVLN